MRKTMSRQKSVVLLLVVVVGGLTTMALLGGERAICPPTPPRYVLTAVPTSSELPLLRSAAQQVAHEMADGPVGAIDLTRPPLADRRRRLDSFARTLRQLKGSRIVLLGTGADSEVSAAQVEEAQDEIAEYVLPRAGVSHVTWTRALSLPS